MRDDQPIDIMQEFVDQYAREEMLAFFEFTVPRPAPPAIAGLCKISRAKSGGSRLKYLSLSFMVDTPDDDARRRVDEALGRMEEGGLHARLSQVVDVVPMPSLNAGAENHLRQADLLLDDTVVPDQFFIQERLIPMICAVTQVALGEIVWWGAQAPPATPPRRSLEAKDESLVGSLTKYLKSWGGAKK